MTHFVPPPHLWAVIPVGLFPSAFQLNFRMRFSPPPRVLHITPISASFHPSNTVNTLNYGPYKRLGGWTLGY